jgi:hypothetical protein
MRHTDDVVSGAEREQDLGRARDEGADAHLATLPTTGFPHCKTQAASIVWRRRRDDSERHTTQPQTNQRRKS